MATPAAEGSDTRANVLAIESARQAAVDRTRRPRWLVAAYSLTLGAAFGMATLRTPTAWAVAGILFVSGVVGFLIINPRLRRRKGRLLKVNGGSTVILIALIAVMVFIGQFSPADSWQPWFAIGVGVAFAAVGYLYIRWDDADTAKKLATGDFDPSDLMP